MQRQYCVFCAIIAGGEPATVRYEDDEVIVFDNVLGWTPVMLLAVPKAHKTQTELWSDLGTVGRVAVEMGQHYAPEGFRILSNFGPLGMQSQPHGHLHILSGLDPELDLHRDPPQSIVDLVSDPAREVSRAEHAVFYDESALLAPAPITLLAAPIADGMSQQVLWQDVGDFGIDLVATGWSASQGGFRLTANFPGPQRLPQGEKGHVHLLAGAFLGHYA